MKEAKKLYHIEAMSDEHILVGTDVKARNEEEAVTTMLLKKTCTEFCGDMEFFTKKMC